MKAHEAPTSSRRDENSLYSLTKRFVKLLWESPDHAISITTAASMLNVVKRRVYDITNVLESIDLLRNGT
ncbi:E2F3 [Enterospora canceri]|uniref:E2F3 n=1 Tax=Enterospora canceri TaxID=1081671 RepID=A0A1Y1S5H6_9MICR|nr:E2F3 [Enterospora canceri]